MKYKELKKKFTNIDLISRQMNHEIRFDQYTK